MKKAVVCKHITCIDNLKLIATSWAELNNKANDGCLFTSPFWALSWLNIYWHNDSQLQVFAFYQGDELIALAPFYIKFNKTFPSLSTLTLLGQGELESEEVAAEYQDLLIIPGYETCIYSLLNEELDNLSCDQMSFERLLSSSHVVQWLNTIFADKSERQFCRYHICTNAAPLAISKNAKSRLNRAKNQLSSMNATSRWLSPEEIISYWPLMKQFHQQRWQAKGKKGAFYHQRFNDFHLKLINEAEDKVKAAAILIEGQPVAIHYYLTDSHTLYFYQSGWDEARLAKCSPGFFLHHWALEHTEKARYDFMMGGQKSSYKQRFPVTSDPMVTIEIINQPVKIKFAKAINKLRRWITQSK